MKTALASLPASLSLQKADRMGVAASVLCAIHCALAPILLLALPSFGRIWAHPASHVLVAIFVVPLAIFSIRKGYRTHKKRWILVSASAGIFFVLAGCALPMFTKAAPSLQSPSEPSVAPSMVASGEGQQSLDNESTTCESGCTQTECELAGRQEDTSGSAQCFDNCCPSLVVDESGKANLHIPPAAIVTTLGGIFLITAHIGNLCCCGHACRNNICSSCA